MCKVLANPFYLQPFKLGFDKQLNKCFEVLHGPNFLVKTVWCYHRYKKKHNNKKRYNYNCNTFTYTFFTFSMNSNHKISVYHTNLSFGFRSILIEHTSVFFVFLEIYGSWQPAWEITMGSLKKNAFFVYHWKYYSI